MRVCPLFPALHPYPSDSARHHLTRAGMGGLRHKSRHKNCVSKNRMRGTFAGTPYTNAEPPWHTQPQPSLRAC
jgi:hypothetical protein